MRNGDYFGSSLHPAHALQVGDHVEGRSSSNCGAVALLILPEQDGPGDVLERLNVADGVELLEGAPVLHRGAFPLRVVPLQRVEVHAYEVWDGVPTTRQLLVLRKADTPEQVARCEQSEVRQCVLLELVVSLRPRGIGRIDQGIERHEW
jgi:hypothetical protein